MRIGKTLALLLSCALLLTMFPSVEGYAVDRQSEPVSAVSDVALYAAGWQKKPTKTVSSASNFPITLNNGDVLQINGTINYTASAGNSPITVAANATVSIIINGSVTLHGANASGKTGATAAIKVPSSSKLYIYSAHDEELSTSTAAPKDTLTVTGGNAAAGTNGEDSVYTITPFNVIGYGYTAYRHEWASGGGAGGLLSSDCTNTVEGCGGGGGGGGWPNGGGGGGGGAECSDAENKNDNTSKGGSGGSGGGVGSTGSSGTSGTTTGTKGHGYNNNRYDAEPGSGGSGASGLSGSGGAGGAGGTEKDRGKNARFDGGDGGAGGDSVVRTTWNTKGSLTLSTANKLNLNSSMGLAYHYATGRATVRPPTLCRTSSMISWTAR